MQHQVIIRMVILLPRPVLQETDLAADDENEDD